MQVEEELARLSPERDMLLTIGVFDGVHPKDGKLWFYRHGLGFIIGAIAIIAAAYVMSVL